MKLQNNSHRNQSWNPSADVLAASLMRVSISEDSESFVGFQSRFSSMSTGSNVNGWGNSMTRKSYKTDLSLLGSSMDAMMEAKQFPSNGPSEDDCWGFFVCAWAIASLFDLSRMDDNKPFANTSFLQFTMLRFTHKTLILLLRAQSSHTPVFKRKASRSTILAAIAKG